MKTNTLIILMIFTGSLFNSCKNSNLENGSAEAGNDDKIEKQETDTAEEHTAVTDFAHHYVDDELAEKVKNHIISEFLTAGDLRAIKEDQRKFEIYKIDLNNDGKQEVFVNFMTYYFCGTGGCTLLLLDSDLKRITNFSPTRTLYIEKTEQKDWNVLFTKTEGNWRKLIYKNGSYPSNPTMVKATKESPSKNAEMIFDEHTIQPKIYTF